MSRAKLSTLRKDPRSILIVVGALYQLIAAFGLSDSPFFGNPILDARYQIEWAFEIAQLGGTGRILCHSPLYSFLVAGLLKIFGWSPWMMVGFHFVMLTATFWLVDQTLAHFKVHRLVHYVTLGILCFYPLYSIYLTVFHKTLLEIFVHVLFLYLGVKLLADSNKTRSSVVALFLGIICGAAILVRPTFQLMAFIILLLIPRPRWARSMCFVLGILPWILWATSHNASISGEKGLVSTSYGFTLFLGNNPGNPEGVSQLLAGNSVSPLREQEAMQKYAEEKSGRKLSLREMNNYYIHQVFTFLTEQPAAFFRIQLNKLYWYWHREEFPDNECASCMMSEVLILRYNPINWSWVALLILPGIAGVLFKWFSTKAIKREELFLAIYGLAAFFSIITFYVSSRLRIGHVALWLVIIACGISYWIEAFRLQRKKRTVLAVALMLLFIPGLLMAFEPAVIYRPEMQALKEAWIYNDLRLFDQATQEARKLPNRAQQEMMLKKIEELRKSQPKAEDLHLLGTVIPKKIPPAKE